MSEYANQIAIQLKIKFNDDSNGCPLKYLACFINPNTKSMDTIVWNDLMKGNMLDDGKITEFLKIVCPKICDMYTLDGDVINTIQNEESLGFSRNGDPLAQFYDKPKVKKIKNLKQEIGEYRRMSTDTKKYGCTNPSTFWSGTYASEIFPQFSRLARAILSVPAKSAGSERSFSQLGYTIYARRSRLHPEMAGNLMLVEEANNHQSLKKMKI